MSPSWHQNYWLQHFQSHLICHTDAPPDPPPTTTMTPPWRSIYLFWLSTPPFHSSVACLAAIQFLTEVLCMNKLHSWVKSFCLNVLNMRHTCDKQRKKDSRPNPLWSSLSLIPLASSWTDQTFSACFQNHITYDELTYTQTNRQLQTSQAAHL